ncbi:hypothetical protein D3C80_2143700 [compost metagenome]
MLDAGFAIGAGNADHLKPVHAADEPSGIVQVAVVDGFFHGGVHGIGRYNSYKGK